MKVVFFYCFVFFFLKNPAQSDWMLPTHIAGSGARTCSIYKTTPSQVNGKDSLTIKFAALEYNTKGKEISLSAFREDSVLDFRTTNTFDSLGNELVKTERDFPNDYFYPSSPPKDGLAKSMYEELHFHNRNRKEVSLYNRKGKLIEKDYYNESYNVELTENHCHLKELFSYDSNERLAEIKTLKLSEKNKFKMTGLILYDSAGRKIKETKDDWNGPTETEYIYDLYGNKIREKIKIKNGKIRMNEYSYNRANKLLESRYDVKNGFAEYADKYLYNGQNRLVSLTSYDANGNYRNRYNYTYQDTLLIGESYSDSDGDYQHSDSIQYDAKGRPLRIKKWSLEGNAYSASGYDPYRLKIRKFDKDSNIIEEKFFFRKKKKEDYAGKSEYAYNQNRQIIKERIFDDEDSLLRIHFNEYNNKGQLSKVMIFDKDSILENIEINFYDSLGVRYARELYHPDKKLQLYQTYSYDKNGKENGGIFFQGGPKITIREYNYGKEGLFSEIKVSDKYGTYFYYKYRYTYY